MPRASSSSNGIGGASSGVTPSRFAKKALSLFQKLVQSLPHGSRCLWGPGVGGYTPTSEQRDRVSAPLTSVTRLGRTTAPLLMRRTRSPPTLLLLLQLLLSVPTVNLDWAFSFLVSLPLHRILVSWDHLPRERPVPETLPQVSLERSHKYAS